LKVWTQAASGEFSCFGVVKKADDSGLINVEKFFLPQQTCSGAHTSPGRESMGALMTELVKGGYDVSYLRCWAHSHADMNTFWSSEDADSIEQMNNGDWLLSIVTNKDGRVLARLDIYAPFRATLDRLPLKYQSTMPHDEELERELHSKVNADIVTHLFAHNAADVPLGQYPCGSAPYAEGLLLDLQSCGLRPDEAAALAQALKSFRGADLRELSHLIDEVLPDPLIDELDRMSIIETLADYGCCGEAP